MYDYIAPPLDPQVYVITEPTETYTYDEFPLRPTDAGDPDYTQSYEILDADGNDATTTYTWLNNFVYDPIAGTFSFDVSETDESLYGTYDLTVRGTLVGPAGTETTEETITITLIDLVPVPQDTLIYILEDTQQTIDPIEPFFVLPDGISHSDGGTYEIDYSTDCLVNTDPAGLLIDSNTEFQIGYHEDPLEAGIFTCTLYGNLNTDIGTEPDVTDSVDYKVIVVDIETDNAFDDVIYRMDAGKLTYPITPVTQSVTSADDPEVIDYTFEYAITLPDGSPTGYEEWLYIEPDGLGGLQVAVDIELANLYGIDPMHVDLAIQVTVVEQPTAIVYDDWKLTLYSYSSIDVEDQLYLMDASEIYGGNY